MGLRVCVKLVLTIIILSIFGGGAALGRQPDDENSSAGFKFGRIGAGDLLIGDLELKTDAAFSVGAFFDYHLHRYLLVGVSVDFHRMIWVLEIGQTKFNPSETMPTIGINIKGEAGLFNRRLILRPGLGLAGGSLRSMEFAGGSNYLIFQTMGELVFRTGGAADLLVEVGLWKTVTGSDNTVSLSIGPLLLARFGLVF